MWSGTLATFALLAACGQAAPTPPVRSPSQSGRADPGDELSPALAPLAWWLRQRRITDGAATFADDTRDFPRTITYALTDDRAGLTAVLDGSRRREFRFTRGHRVPAPELEAADLAFAAATAERGTDGWVAAFDPQGGMMRRSGRVEYAAIAEAMAPTLTSGKLAWAPIASGRSGDLGFTIGKATFTAARPDDSWRSTYATIWRRQPDGSWKVLFDTGRIVQEP